MWKNKRVYENPEVALVRKIQFFRVYPDFRYKDSNLSNATTKRTFKVYGHKNKSVKRKFNIEIISFICYFIFQ